MGHDETTTERFCAKIKNFNKILTEFCDEIPQKQNALCFNIHERRREVVKVVII